VSEPDGGGYASLIKLLSYSHLTTRYESCSVLCELKEQSGRRDSTILKNSIKIGLRQIRKRKIHSLISVLGLAIGLACSLLILLYVLGEVGYNTAFPNSNRIYRVTSDKQWAKVVEPRTPYPLAPAMKAQFPEVELVARSQWMYDAAVKLGEEYVSEFYFVSADPEIFDLFSLNVIEGAEERLLEDPNSIVISQRAAVKYFGEENPMGRVLSVTVGQHAYEFNVTGVLKISRRKRPTARNS